MNEKKYTFCNMKTCTGKNGTYVGCTLEALVTRPTELRKTNHGNQVISFSTPINGRAKAIEKMTGLAPKADATDTVWATVTFFDNEFSKTATRFHNFMKNAEGKGIVLIVTGRISVDTHEKDGVVYHNCNVIGDDFTVMRSFTASGTQTQEKEPKKEEAKLDTSMPAAAPVSDTVPDGFIPISDDELPF